VGLASNLAGLVGISNTTMTIGTGSGNFYQRRQTGGAAQSAAALVTAVASNHIFVTEIHWSVPGVSPGNDLTLTFAAAASGEPSTPSAGGHNIIAKGGTSDSRVFRNPWKITSAVNNALNLTVALATGNGATAFVGTWEVIVHGYINT
jgi:hypothetical protein